MAAAVPAKSKSSWLFQAGGIVAAAAPGIGVIPRCLYSLNAQGLYVPQYVGPATLGLASTLGLFYMAQGSRLWTPPKRRGIYFGDMFLAEKSFWTGVLITGRPGAGKTSGAIMPPTEQLFKLFLGEDHIQEEIEGVMQWVENPHARLGGLVLEVKGEFYEMIAYLMHQCSRNVYEDFLIIRPDSEIPVGCFQDPKTGYYFYFNGIPCQSGSECGHLLKHAYDIAKTDRNNRVREDIFSCFDKEFDEALPKLRELTYSVDSKTEFVGWRREGNKLRRVSHTPKFNEVEYLNDAEGKPIVIDVPKELKFVHRVLISNGLRYNLIDPSLNHTVAGEKLAQMASVAGRGEKAGGDNSYWYTNGVKLISSCIQLLRETRSDSQVTCADIYHLIASEKELETELKTLGNRITAQRADLKKIDDPDKRAEREARVIEPLNVLNKYFTGEWAEVDSKQKSTIKMVVTNTFQIFVQDPGLKATYCAPSTFSFRDCPQKGRVFAFVPGPYYERMSKTLGTGLKLDAQYEWLQRVSRADMNKLRALLLLTDECWNWVIASGSDGGDPKFLSLCRQARVINLLATQSYDQFETVIGGPNTKNFLSQFGCFVWLQNFNRHTYDFAVDLMEDVKREKIKGSSGSLTGLLTLDKEAAKATVESTWEKVKLYTKEDFIKLRGDEAIVLNGDNDGQLAEKTTLPKSDLTHPKEQPKIARFMREFLRGSIEQALWREGRVSRVNHIGTGTAKTAAAARQNPLQEKAANPVSQPTLPTANSASTTSKTPEPQSQKQAAQALSETRKDAPVAQQAQETGRGHNPEQTASADSLESRQQPSKPVPRPHQKWVFNMKAPDTDPTSGQSAQFGRGSATPSQIDKESEAFREQWSRLVVAAAEISSGDDLQMNSWVQDLLKKKKNGDSVGPDIVAGPNGFSAGNKDLRTKVNPLKTDSLDQLQQQQDAGKEVHRTRQTEQVYHEQAGPGGKFWWQAL